MPTAAEVQMVNQALFLVGNEPVPDLSDASLEQSVAAVKLLRIMEQSRDKVLERHGWLCALEYRTLAPEILEGYVNFRYATTYGLPGNALRVWEIAGYTFDGSERCWEPRWQVGTWETDAGARLIIRALETSSSLNVVYVRRCNWASLSAHVRDTVAYDMAARAVYSINGDLAAQQSLTRQAEARLVEAIGQDGTQEGGQPPLAPSIPAQIRRYAESGGPYPFGGTSDFFR